MNLYQIDKKINSLIEWEFENQEEAQQLFLDLELAKDEKIENTVKWIRSIQNDYEAIDNEINRLKELKENKKNRIEKAKNLLSFVLNNEWYETSLFKISFRKSESIIVSDDFNDKRFIKEKITETVDKTEIKKAIKSGEVINGAIVQEKQNIQIK